MLCIGLWEYTEDDYQGHAIRQRQNQAEGIQLWFHRRVAIHACLSEQTRF